MLCVSAALIGDKDDIHAGVHPSVIRRGRKGGYAGVVNRLVEGFNADVSHGFGECKFSVARFGNAVKCVGRNGYAVLDAFLQSNFRDINGSAFVQGRRCYVFCAQRYRTWPGNIPEDCFKRAGSGQFYAQARDFSVFQRGKCEAVRPGICGQFNGININACFVEKFVERAFLIRCVVFCTAKKQRGKAQESS